MHKHMNVFAYDLSAQACSGVQWAVEAVGTAAHLCLLHGSCFVGLARATGRPLVVGRGLAGGIAAAVLHGAALDVAGGFLQERIQGSRAELVQLRETGSWSKVQGPWTQNG